jgi:hypothetical protein
MEHPSGAERDSTWRPDWITFDDIGNEKVVIDDYDSPYIGADVTFHNDDNNAVAPKVIDVPLPFVDDSHLAWLEVVAVRTYEVALEEKADSNATCLTVTYGFNEQFQVTEGLQYSEAVNVQVSEKISGKVADIGVEVGAAGGITVTLSSTLSTTHSQTDTLSTALPPCYGISIYKVYKVHEVQVDYVFMNDTVLGGMYGFWPESGRATLTSTDYVGLRAKTSATPILCPSPSPTS